jgi:hypothetical protein
MLEKKKGHKFSKDQAEWLIHSNFIQMYDEVYDAMERAGVAEKVQPMCIDVKQQATDEENRFGHQATHLLLCPDYVVFIDEFGCNTSQEGDGARGGEKKLAEEQWQKKQQQQTATTLLS